MINVVRYLEDQTFCMFPESRINTSEKKNMAKQEWEFSNTYGY